MVSGQVLKSTNFLLAALSLWIISFRQCDSEDWHLIVSVIIGLREEMSVGCKIHAHAHKQHMSNSGHGQWTQRQSRWAALPL